MAIFNSKLLVYQRVWIQKHAVDLQWFCWSFNSSILPIRGQHCLQNLLHYSGPGSQDFAPYSNHGRLWKSEKKHGILKKNHKNPAICPSKVGEKIWKDMKRSGLAIHNPSSDSSRQPGMGHDYFLPLKNPPIRSFEIGTNPGTLW